MADTPSPDNQADKPWQFEPGEGTTSGTTTQPEDPVDMTTESSVEVPESSQEVSSAQDDESATAFSQTANMSPPAQEEFVDWTASEFIAHEKSTGWYVALVVTMVVIGFLVWLITKSIFSVVVVVLCAALFGYFASHKPRELHYAINQAGLTIEDKLYNYGDFKSFSVLPEGAFSSIVFMPLKRFLPPLTIYYDPADEAKIVAVLSARIPLEPGRRDAVDRFVTRIRF